MRSCVCALIQPSTVRRQENTNACKELPSITASSTSRSNGAVAIFSHTNLSCIGFVAPCGEATKIASGGSG